jgi:hypothetical protein
MVSRLRTRLALRLRQGVKVRRILKRRLFEVGQQEADDGLFLRVADLPGIVPMRSVVAISRRCAMPGRFDSLRNLSTSCLVMSWSGE